MNTRASREVLLAGCGAIGSRFETAGREPAWTFTFADAQPVMPENLGPADFSEADLFREKAVVLAERRRARGGVARALPGDLRYTLRPGLARALDAAILCLDNPAGLHDAARVLWGARENTLPVLSLTCGIEAGTYQARLFVPPATCPVCLFGAANRRADELSLGTSCADTSAPRAAAAAAEAAARAGVAILARWESGDLGLANCRIQRDAGSRDDYVIRMPPPAPRCPIAHGDTGESSSTFECLGGNIRAISVGELAERALLHLGGDAEILLGRRGVPLGGLHCPRCRARWSVPPLLIPAAQAAERPCTCRELPQPIGTRGVVTARELQDGAVASLSLAAWGAGHGDEFIVTGRTRKGSLRLSCTFDWSDLDD